jgi:hypothetical protein
MTYPNTEARLRTDLPFHELSDEEHHLGFLFLLQVLAWLASLSWHCKKTDTDVDEKVHLVVI